MNSRVIFQFDHDPKVKDAYKAYEYITEVFYKKNKRHPLCDLLIGTGPGVKSSVIARWNAGTDCNDDLDAIVAIASIYSNNIN